MLSLLYEIGKDIKEYLTWKEQDKLVDSEWLTISGMEEKMNSKGFQLRLCRPDNVEARKLKGWEIVYDLDETNRIRYKLVAKDGSVLMGKKKSP